MEARGEARERSSEGEALSSSQDVIIREISSGDIPMASPEESTKAKEKKLHYAQSKSSIVPTAHHRSSHSLDRHGQSSSTGGALDLQSLVRSGSSSSSISGITVPIRLDALSYLLNNAVLGAYKMPSQTPCYPPMYPACPYTQMGYSYGPCMSQPPCNVPYMNQFPACQPGLMSCGTQQGIQACQNPMPNINQFMGGTIPNPNQGVFTSIPPQSGTPFNTSIMNTTTSVQDNRGTFQSDNNTWPRKTNDGFRNNKGNPLSSDYEKRSSPPPQRGFTRFGDKQSEDSWSGRPQNSFNRGSGRGRGDFGGRSWQGERSWNTDGGRKRFQESPDRFQDRGSSFKRGRWQNGRGNDGENRDSWQQRNKQSFFPPWSKEGTSQDRSKSNEEEKVVTKTDESNAQDEDWEMDYVGEPAPSKTSDQSSLHPTSKTCESTKTLKPPEKTIHDNEDIPVKGVTTSPVHEKEEGELDSCPDKTNLETIEKDPTLGPAEKTEEGEVEDVYTLIVDGDDNKGILLVDAEGQ